MARMRSILQVFCVAGGMLQRWDVVGQNDCAFEGVDFSALNTVRSAADLVQLARYPNVG